MSYQVYPEYEFFTGVKIDLFIDGEDKKSFTISKLGEHFQGLNINEGNISGSGAQLTSPNGGSVASGSITLYDEDNSIFMSLLASKSPEGNFLLNKVDITIDTYTGSRVYPNCRINSWTCDFGNGVPTIKLEWQCLDGGSSPSTANPNVPAFDADKAKDLLKDVGVSDFKDFKNAITSIFDQKYRFAYSKTREYSVSNLSDMGDDGSLIVFKDDKDTKGSKGYIFIPDNCKEEVADGIKRLRMEMKGKMSNYSFVQALLSEFCKTAKVSLKKDSEENPLQLGFRIVGENVILLFSFIDLKNLTIPQKDGTAEILNQTVFIYNSSAVQGSIYTTPLGDKRVFTITDLSTSFDINNVIMTHLNDQSNKGNVNGNMVVTSRGAITIPDKVPQALAQSLQNLASLSLTENVKVTMTVYNFIHFFALGETPVYIIAFDHLGRVHPISGRMKIGSYKYSIGVSGVIKADVELTPVYSNNAEDFSTPIIGSVSGVTNTSLQQSTSSSSDNSSGDSASSSLGYTPVSSEPQGSYVDTGVTLDSAIDYTVQNKG